MLVRKTDIYTIIKIIVSWTGFLSIQLAGLCSKTITSEEESEDSESLPDASDSVPEVLVMSCSLNSLLTDVWILEYPLKNK